MRNSIILYINGQRHEVREGVFTSLSSYLREHLGLPGTKVVCAEGDCGSCTVLQGKPAGDTIRYRAVCSCIQLLAQLDATHIITVEGLAPRGELNSVQQAMIQCHGSQCGFCTPGFVVAMTALVDEQPTASTPDWRRGLVGNLCRCTGYEPMLTAGEQIVLDPPPKLTALFDTATIAAELRTLEEQDILLAENSQLLYKPITVNAAIAFLEQHPTATILAGGTDLGVQANKGTRQFQTVLSTRSLTELVGIEIQPDQLIVGANTTLAELEQVTLQQLPNFGELLAWFGSPLIKHAGTLGGNIANGSPIGDTMPGLIALDAAVELSGPRGSRWVKLADFYTGYRQNVRQTSELLTRVKIPLPRDNELLRVYKVSKRKDLDISTVTAALWVHRVGNMIQSARLVLGGVGPMIVRLPKTEALVTGQPWSRELWSAAGQLAVTEISPISDVRGSARYRNLVAANLFLKFCDEVDRAAAL